MCVYKLLARLNLGPTLVGMHDSIRMARHGRCSRGNIQAALATAFLSEARQKHDTPTSAI